ncbi:MAG: hypothetical protein KJ000_28655, partial [Pirellulaceae bacterium]|nr:hypothetical protein [Pirellulaceae bacterium]
KARELEAARGLSDELQAEYRFDYSKAKPNRFASRVDPTRVVVALDPDVAEVFADADAVNKVLRALIEAMPRKKRTTKQFTPEGGSELTQLQRDIDDFL